MDPFPALLSLVSKAGSEILPKAYVESCGGMEVNCQVVSFRIS